MRLNVLSMAGRLLPPLLLVELLPLWPPVALRALYACKRRAASPADVEAAPDERTVPAVPGSTKRAPMTRRVRWRSAARGSRSRCVHEEEPNSRSCCSRVLPA